MWIEIIKVEMCNHREDLRAIKSITPKNYIQQTLKFVNMYLRLSVDL